MNGSAIAPERSNKAMDLVGLHFLAGCGTLPVMTESTKPNSGYHNQLPVEMEVVEQGVTRRFGDLWEMMRQDHQAELVEIEALRRRAAAAAARLDTRFERLLKRISKEERVHLEEVRKAHHEIRRLVKAAESATARRDNDAKSGKQE